MKEELKGKSSQMKKKGQGIKGRHGDGDGERIKGRLTTVEKTRVIKKSEKNKYRMPRKVDDRERGTRFT